MIIASLLPCEKFAQILPLEEDFEVSAADDVNGLLQILQESDVALLIVDPNLCDEYLLKRIANSSQPVQSIPILVYASLSPNDLARAWRLARDGTELVLMGVHDDPLTLRHLMTRAVDRSVENMLLSRIQHLLERLPISVASAIVTATYSPEKARSGDDLARMAMTTRRSLYRAMADVDLRPRDVIECAQVLRAYLLLRDPLILVKEVTTRLGFADARTLNSVVVKWTGFHPSELRHALTVEDIVTRLATQLDTEYRNPNQPFVSLLQTPIGA